jgi:hypothetical protein
MTDSNTQMIIIDSDDYNNQLFSEPIEEDLQPYEPQSNHAPVETLEPLINELKTRINEMPTNETRPSEFQIKANEMVRTKLDAIKSSIMELKVIVDALEELGLVDGGLTHKVETLVLLMGPHK